MKTHMFKLSFVLLAIAIIVAGCSSPTPTPVPPTQTPLPTNISVPTATEIPSPVPPTIKLVATTTPPPTSTPLAPIATITLTTAISGTAELYYQRGMDSIKNGNYAGAIPEFDQAINLKPDHADSYYYRGMVYDYKMDLAHAISDYTTAIKLKPEKIDLYMLRAVAYHRIGDYDQAITDWNQYIKLKPDSASAYQKRGVTFANKGDFVSSIANYDQAIKLKSDYAEAYIARGIAFWLKGENALATADLEKASQIGDSYINQDLKSLLKTFTASPSATVEERKSAVAEFFAMRAALWANVMDFEPALDDATQAIRLKPDFANAYAIRGMTYEMRGMSSNQEINVDLALADFDRAIQLNPKDVTSYMSRARIHAQKSNYYLAIADYEMIIKLKPDDATMYLGRAEAYYNNGLRTSNPSDFDHAIIDCDEFIKRMSDFSEYGFLLRGSVYKAKGEREKAIADFKKILEITKNTQLLNEAQARLSELGVK